MKETSVKYPQLFRSTSTEALALYFRSELETLSDQTLELYFQDVSKALNVGRNLAEERYAFLAQMLGYSSIDDWIKASLS